MKQEKSVLKVVRSVKLVVFFPPKMGAFSKMNLDCLEALNSPLKNGNKVVVHVAYVRHILCRLFSCSTIQDGCFTCQYIAFIFLFFGNLGHTIREDIRQGIPSKLYQ